jgi:hypothetical protein
MKRQPIQLLVRTVSVRIMRTAIAPRIEQPGRAGWKRFNQASGQR